MNVQNVTSKLQKGGNTNKEVKLVVENKEYSIDRISVGIDSILINGTAIVPTQIEGEEDVAETETLNEEE